MQRITSIAALVAVFTTAHCQFAHAQAAPAAAPATTEKKEPAPTPVPLESGKAVLTPKNTTIQFTGTHKGDKPDPRVGNFAKFVGEFVVDPATKAPVSTSLEIDTNSLTTPIGRLTTHLKGPDFFDAREFPNAKFKSTKVEAVDAAAGKFKMTGDLTIRDKTKPVTFPVELKLSQDGAIVTSKFDLKRSEFGITFGPDRVNEEVAMVVTIGRPTPKIESN